MKRIFYPALAATLLSVTANAQQNLGIATSNWSSVNSMYLNPANLADSHEKLTINLFSFGASLDNNLGTVSTSGVGKAVNDGNTNIFNYSSRNTFSLLAPAIDLRGPGAIFSINHRHTIALTTGIRGFNQLNNFDKSLYRTINDPNTVTTGDLDLTSKNFNYTAQLWTEIGLSYAAVLLDQGESELRAGITVRYLGGIGYVGLKGKNMDAHFRSGVDSFYAKNTDLEFASNVLTTNEAIFNGLSHNSVLSEFFGAKEGMGVGGDIGVVYDYTPDPSSRKHSHHNRSTYKVRLSASVTDIGSIKYKSDVNFNANVTGNGYLTGQGLVDNVRSFDDFRAYAKRQGFTADTARAATRLYMPTALHLSADYNIHKNFYVNAMFIGNLANRQNFGNSYYNQVTVTPRYDRRLFTVAVPFTYSMLTNGMKMGLGLRFSGFFVGSDDMLALFANNQYGFNFYVGGCVPFYHKTKGHYWCREDDADTTDMAPEPDMEHGGAKDTTDDCPDLVDATLDSPAPADVILQQGHNKDSDGDGIPDDEDACPNVAGPASNHGCPTPKEAPKKTVNFSTTTIQMGTSVAAVNKEAAKKLDQLVTILREYPDYGVMVNGYSDNSNTAARSLALSKSRAELVKKYLVRKGIAGERIEVKFFGAEHPVAANTSEEGKAKNNRVVINLKKK
jgi:outer membrane protein OmpA-like peptidoglycan-associated protein